MGQQFAVLLLNDDSNLGEIFCKTSTGIMFSPLPEHFGYLCLYKLPKALAARIFSVKREMLQLGLVYFPNYIS